MYNILAFVAFGFCVMEIMLRIIAEPDYFHFGIASCQGNRFGHVSVGNDNHTTCSFGSFLFWCDLISTGMILFDISWINKQRFELNVVEIELDEYGYAVCSNK